MFKIDELLKITSGKWIVGSKIKEVKAISLDSRSIKKGEAFIAIKGDNFDGHDFIGEAIAKGAVCIIREKAEMGYRPLAQAGVIEVMDTQKALGDIARFLREKSNIPFIAVTGSNGKTTTKDMIAWVLSKRFDVLKNEGTKNNQIGVPLTLLNLRPNHQIAVLELGTNHFGEIDYLAKICQPNIGIITNIGYAHLEYLKDLKGVFKEKYALVDNLKRPYISILNADDPFLRKKLIGKSKRTVIFGVGIKNKSDFFASDIRGVEKGIEFLINPDFSGGKGKKGLKIKLDTFGFHNVYNALVAAAVARIFGMDYEEIAFRLSLFKLPPGRLNFTTVHNIKFIDDTYNSNPVSFRQALNTLSNFKTKGRKILVMGDMLELGVDEKILHSQAGEEVVGICDTFIGVGDLSKLAVEAAKKAGFDIKNIFTCESSQKAREVLFNQISPGKDDIVLVKGSRLMGMEKIFNYR